MSRSANKINVYLEIGKKRTFASAIDWHGWCRSGRDEASALQALIDYGPRYRRVLQSTRFDFRPPEDVYLFRVIERLEGNATTDFGAPGMPPSKDMKPVSADDLKRLQEILQACWRAFDASVKAATGQPLRTGPRGGGRALEGIIRHLLDGDRGYLGQLGWKLEQGRVDSLEKELDRTRKAIVEGLTASAHGELPAQGPRGGKRWRPRYFVRRVAWHVLDHAWELEDRLLSEAQ